MDSNYRIRETTTEIACRAYPITSYFQSPHDKSFFDRSLIEPLRPIEMPKQMGKDNGGFFYMIKLAETILNKPLEDAVSAISW